MVTTPILGQTSEDISDRVTLRSKPHSDRGLPICHAVNSITEDLLVSTNFLFVQKFTGFKKGTLNLYWP